MLPGPRSVDEEARRSRQEFAADYEARELQRQEDSSTGRIDLKGESLGDR